MVSSTLYNKTYGVQSSERCIACASTHAPNTRPPQYHYAPCHKHKSLHIASHRDHRETKDKSNRTTSLIRPQPRRLFLGPGSLTRSSAYVVSAPNSSYRLPIGYFGYCFSCQIPSRLLQTLLGLDVNFLLVGYF